MNDWRLGAPGVLGGSTFPGDWGAKGAKKIRKSRDLDWLTILQTSFAVITAAATSKIDVRHFAARFSARNFLTLEGVYAEIRAALLEHE